MGHVVVNVLVMMEANDESGSPSDGVKFTFQKHDESDESVKVHPNGDIVLPKGLRKEVLITFFLAKNEMIWKGKAYRVNFRPNGNQKARTRVKLKGPKYGNDKIHWPEKDNEFDFFRLSSDWGELSFVMRNKAKHYGGLIDYPYALIVSLYDGTTHIADVEHDPAIRNGGGNGFFINREILRSFLIGAGVGALFAFATLKFFSH